MKNNHRLFRYFTLSFVAVGLALWCGGAATSTPAAVSTATTTATASADEEAVANTYRAWLKAVGKAHGDAAQMLKFYAPDAILVATFSPKLLHNDEGELVGYFKKFTALPNIQGTTQDLQTRVYGDWAINTGLYTFTYDSPDGDKVSVPARFTYVYHKVGDQWLIVDHHSSVVPIAL
jgi:uncharacterized protein (TIGR02246 family)